MSEKMYNLVKANTFSSSVMLQELSSGKSVSLGTVTNSLLKLLDTEDHDFCVSNLGEHWDFTVTEETAEKLKEYLKSTSPTMIMGKDITKKTRTKTKEKTMKDVKLQTEEILQKKREQLAQEIEEYNNTIDPIDVLTGFAEYRIYEEEVKNIG